VLEAVCNVAVAKKIRVDDRSPATDRGAMIEWLRELRSGRRAYRPDEVEDRVLALARARLDYDTLRVEFDGEDFRYVGVRGAAEEG
jgi:hypothetical protein